MWWRGLAILFILCCAAHSEESSPREAKLKIETAQANGSHGRASQQITVPANNPVPTTINVFAGKHSNEDNSCSQLDNRKEWVSFAWCRSVEWIDAEKTIAIFTVILGIATGFLWWATRNLVIDARKNVGRQLRAYISATPTVISSAKQEERFVQIVFQLKNHGQTPAREMHYIFSVEVFPNPLPVVFSYPAPTVPLHSEAALFPQGEMSVWFNFNRLVSTEEFSLIERDELRFHVWGHVFYKTAFEDQEQCQTDFRASVGGPAFIATLRANRRNQKSPGFMWTWESGHGNGN